MNTINRRNLTIDYAFNYGRPSVVTPGIRADGPTRTPAATNTAPVQKAPDTAAQASASMGLGSGSGDLASVMMEVVRAMLAAVVQLLGALFGQGGNGTGTGTGTDTGSVTPGSSGGVEPGSSGSGTQLKENTMWDVFFDRKSGTKTKQQSPIVLDLNGNGQADITGSNIVGNGKIEGKPLNGFDLNPNDRQWKKKSVMRRPGRGAPELPKGTMMKVYDETGKLVRTQPAPTKFESKDRVGLKAGERAEFWNPQGQLVSELKRSEGKLMYFFENANQNEWMKKWDGNSGDGLLVWDKDNDGKITGGKELFGEFDADDGKQRFQNGYQKLAHYFDRDGDGRVHGNELAGLKIWEDRNGDGITQDGELVELSKYAIDGFDVRNADNPDDDMRSTYTTRK